MLLCLHLPAGGRLPQLGEVIAENRSSMPINRHASPNWGIFGRRNASMISFDGDRPSLRGWRETGRRSVTAKPFSLLLLASALCWDMAGAEARKLPEKATPMSADEVKLIYFGNSVTRDGSLTYFSKDMTVKVIIEADRKRTAYSGSWYVAGNEICVKIQMAPQEHVDCWKWWWHDTETFTLWSVRFDGSKPDSDGFYDATPSIRKGDAVSDEYKRLGGPPSRVCIQC